MAGNLRLAEEVIKEKVTGKISPCDFVYPRAFSNEIKESHPFSCFSDRTKTAEQQSR